MTISRAEALRIAKACLRGDEIRQGFGIQGVSSGDEAAGLMPYGLSVPLEKCWIAYVQEPVLALRSSTIILINKDSGRVVFSGSANDEG